jgi:hypothetical protein
MNNNLEDSFLFAGRKVEEAMQSACMKVGKLFPLGNILPHKNNESSPFGPLIPR